MGGASRRGKGKIWYSGFPKPCNRKVESGSDWRELVGQIAHIDHVTRFLQLQDFGKPLYSGFPKPCNRKVESGSDWSELVGQIAHIDHVTGLCSCKILENRCTAVFQNLATGKWKAEVIGTNWLVRLLILIM